MKLPETGNFKKSNKLPTIVLALPEPSKHGSRMERRKVTFIGFGEAGQAFAEGLNAAFGAYDRKTTDFATRDVKLADYRRFGAIALETSQDAARSTDLILSLVTADQALAVALEIAGSVETGTLFCDMNSVAPDTKRAAALAIEASGGLYVDVAVMAPVHPQQRNVPLLASGPHAHAGAAALRALGFTSVRHQPGPVGAASSIKMIRSVMVKGIEALTAECLLAATRAGVRDEVIASLDASWPGAEWGPRADHNLDRMMIHGLRRAAEMEEVVKTLDGLGTGAQMTRGTVERQRAIGGLELGQIGSLDAKIAAILGAAQEKGA